MGFIKINSKLSEVIMSKLKRATMTVRTAISLGYDMKTTIKKVRLLGYKSATIRAYYKALSKYSEV